MKKKVVIFGLGKMFEIFAKLCDREKLDILALSDNNMSERYVQKKEKVFENVPIIPPEKIVEYELDYVVVTNSYFDDVKRQLIGFGIEENKIIGFAEIYQRLTDVHNPVMEILKNDLFMAIIAQNPQDDGMSEVKNIQEKTLLLNAKAYINTIKNCEINSLEEAEFQVFSQWGEDGIIQWLIHNVQLDRKIFIEFGVEDYKEANTRFLLMNNNWSGFVIDGNEENIRKIKERELYWKYDLNAFSCFITKENINSMILDKGVRGDIGLLSVDVDGNDYWILNAIKCIQPRILICEYNNVFGADKKVTVPYDKNFRRTDKHYSNLYWGCSLGALCDWAKQNGYIYMGSNSAGNNAFFVRNDCISYEKIPKNRNIFVESKYRESRDENGKLTYIRGKERLCVIKDLELVNLESGCVECIKDIYQL